MLAADSRVKSAVERSEIETRHVSVGYYTELQRRGSPKSLSDDIRFVLRPLYIIARSSASSEAHARQGETHGKK